MASRDTGDRAGQDVIEHQGGDADLGEGAAQGLLHHAIHTTTNKHGAALDVDGANREGEQHDRQNEPRRGLADCLLGYASGVKSGGTKVVQHYGGGPPIGNKSQHHRGRNHDANSV